jgi:hypothetical protein
MIIAAVEGVIDADQMMGMLMGTLLVLSTSLLSSGHVSIRRLECSMVNHIYTISALSPRIRLSDKSLSGH